MAALKLLFFYSVGSWEVSIHTFIQHKSIPLFSSNPPPSIHHLSIPFIHHLYPSIHPLSIHSSLVNISIYPFTYPFIPWFIINSSFFSFIYPSINSFIHPSLFFSIIHPLILPYTHPSIHHHIFINLSPCTSIYFLFIHSSIHLFFLPSIPWFIHPFIHRCVQGVSLTSRALSSVDPATAWQWETSSSSSPSCQTHGWDEGDLNKWSRRTRTEEERGNGMRKQKVKDEEKKGVARKGEKREWRWRAAHQKWKWIMNICPQAVVTERKERRWMEGWWGTDG